MIAKRRDNFTCVRCGKKPPFQMHGSHIHSVRFDVTCADPENILCLCANCHKLDKDSWHESPAIAIKWLDETYPGLRQRLLDKINTQLPPQDWLLELKRLKEIEKKYLP